MTRNDPARMSHNELIDLALMHAEQNAKPQAEVEALRLKLEKKKKPPTYSGNSSQPPSQDQKGNLPPKRKKHKHGPPQRHVKYERRWVAQPDHIVEIRAKVCQHFQTDISQAKVVLLDVN